MPIIDDNVSIGRLWGLFIFPIGVFICVVLVSKYYPMNSAWLQFVVLALVPTIVLLSSYQLISGQRPWALFGRVTGKEWRHTLMRFVL